MEANEANGAGIKYAIAQSCDFSKQVTVNQ